MKSEKRDIIELQCNDYIKYNLNFPAEKLLNFSLSLIERNKILNEDFAKLIKLQKELKLRAINNSNKKMEILILEKRLKTTGSKKINLNIKNILECYSIILKNNEELLNRRIAQFNERDSKMTQKEFLLSKIRYTFNTFNNDGVNYLKISHTQINSNLAGDMIAEEIQKQFQVFHNKKNSISSNNEKSRKGESKNNQISKNENFFIINGTSKSLGKAPVNKLVNKNLEENDWENVNKYENKIYKKRKFSNNSNSNAFARTISSSNATAKDSGNNTSDENEGNKKIFRAKTSSKVSRRKSKENEEEINSNERIEENENETEEKDLNILSGNRNTGRTFTKGNSHSRVNSKNVRGNNNNVSSFSDEEDKSKIEALKRSIKRDIRNESNEQTIKKGNVVRVNSIGKKKEEQTKYTGLLKNFEGNKSYEKIGLAQNKKMMSNSTIKTNKNIKSKNNSRNNSINLSHDQEEKDENNLRRESKGSVASRNQKTSLNKNVAKNDSDSNEINQDILSKLLKEADEDAKRKKEIILNGEAKKKITTINMNDKNLLRISNLLGSKKENKEEVKKDVIITKEIKETKLIVNNNFAEGVLFLNQQNGLFNNKNKNLQITSGLDNILAEEKEIKEVKNLSKTKVQNKNIASAHIFKVGDERKDKIKMDNEIKENISNKKRASMNVDVNRDKNLNINNYEFNKNHPETQSVNIKIINKDSIVNSKSMQKNEDKKGSFKNKSLKNLNEDKKTSKVNINSINSDNEYNKSFNKKNSKMNTSNFSYENKNIKDIILKKNSLVDLNQNETKTTNLVRGKSNNIVKRQSINENKNNKVTKEKKLENEMINKNNENNIKSFKKKLEFSNSNSKNLNNNKNLSKKSQKNLNIKEKSNISLQLETREEYVLCDNEQELENSGDEVIKENEKILVDEITIQKNLQYDEELLTNELLVSKDIDLDNMKNLQKNEKKGLKSSEVKRVEDLSNRKSDKIVIPDNNESNVSELNLNMFLKNNNLNQIENDKENLIEYPNDGLIKKNSSHLDKYNNNKNLNINRDQEIITKVIKFDNSNQTKIITKNSIKIEKRYEKTDINLNANANDKINKEIKSNKGNIIYSNEKNKKENSQIYVDCLGNTTKEKEAQDLYLEMRRLVSDKINNNELLNSHSNANSEGLNNYFSVNKDEEIGYVKKYSVLNVENHDTEDNNEMNSEQNFQTKTSFITQDVYNKNNSNSNMSSIIGRDFNTLDEEYDESKLDDYQEHLKKMKLMVDESKKIEENMKEYADMVDNIYGKSKEAE